MFGIHNKNTDHIIYELNYNIRSIIRFGWVSEKLGFLRKLIRHFAWPVFSASWYLLKRGTCSYEGVGENCEIHTQITQPPTLGCYH